MRVRARRCRRRRTAASSAEIARLHGPIGLNIGSRTPAEIAVSIAAELVAVRNGVLLTQKKPGSALPVAVPTTRT